MRATLTTIDGNTQIIHALGKKLMIILSLSCMLLKAITADVKHGPLQQAKRHDHPLTTNDTNTRHETFFISLLLHQQKGWD